MTNIWPIGGSKGGTGKSFLACNLGTWLAKQGNKTLLIDADFGGPNLHTLFGIPPQDKSLSDFLNRKIETLAEAVIETRIPNLFLISGARNNLDMANMGYQQKMKIFRAISQLSYDYILVDLGAGTSFNTIDFFLISDSGIFVTTPEPTSIENVYRLIRAVYARKIRQHLHSYRFRTLMEETKAKGKGNVVTNPEYLLSAIKEREPEKGKSVEEALQASQFKLVVNQFRKPGDPKMGASICRVIEKHLGLPVQFIGNIPYDDLVHDAVCQKVPFLDKYAHTQTSTELRKLCQHFLEAQKMGARPSPAKKAPEKVAGMDTINGEVGGVRCLLDLTHYELLDLSPGALPFQIGQAYKRALEVYREDAMVSYSLFSAEERKEILGRLAEAFFTLNDERARAAYDRSLIEQGALKEEARHGESTRTPLSPEGGVLPAPESLAVKKLLSQEVLTGMDLKKLRTDLGVSLEEITERTMIRSRLLWCIEEDQYDQLPSRFHLKSFLKAYAQYLHLDPEFVMKAYLKRINGNGNGQHPNPSLSPNFPWDFYQRSVRFLKRIGILGGQNGVAAGQSITIHRSD